MPYIRKPKLDRTIAEEQNHANRIAKGHSTFSGTPRGQLLAEGDDEAPTCASGDNRSQANLGNGCRWVRARFQRD